METIAVMQLCEEMRRAVASGEPTPVLQLGEAVVSVRAGDHVCVALGNTLTAVSLASDMMARQAQNPARYSACQVGLNRAGRICVVSRLAKPAEPSTDAVVQVLREVLELAGVGIQASDLHPNDAACGDALTVAR